MDSDALINDFATRSFRDIADQDYIAARLSYRHGLIPQFHWQTLQALEKYLKAILLYNRIKAIGKNKIGHNLDKAFALTKELPFELKLSEPTTNFFNHINRFGPDRYLSASYSIHGPKLVELDQAVWELRHYCQVINYELLLTDGTKKNMLKIEVDKIEKSQNKFPRNFQINNGILEKIINDKNHISHSALVWQNGFFTLKVRRTVSSQNHFQGVNAPLWLHPDILEEVIKYAFIPSDEVKAYRMHAQSKLKL